MSAQTSNDETGKRSEKREGFLSKHFGVLVPVVVALLGFVWLQTPSGRDACLSKEWGPTIKPACREAWVRIQDAEAQEYFDNLVADIDDPTRPKGEVWNQYFRADSDQNVDQERADFAESLKSTLHVEAVEHAKRVDPNLNKFSVKIRRYIYSTNPQPNPYYAGHQVYAIEDSFAVNLRRIDGEILALRPTRVLVSNLRDGRQPRYMATKDTAFLRAPETGSAGIRPINSGEMVWILCLQRPAGENSPPQWGRTYIGWVKLSLFTGAEEDGKGLSEVWYCKTDG